MAQAKYEIRRRCPICGAIFQIRTIDAIYCSKQIYQVMKTPMKRTEFKVILRKSEYKEQWSLLIEIFPVFEPGKEKPLRKHEPLGRFITTPIFDKNSSGRTLPDG